MDKIELCELYPVVVSDFLWLDFKWSKIAGKFDPQNTLLQALHSARG